MSRTNEARSHLHPPPRNMKPPILENSLAAAFARMPLTMREAAKPRPVPMKCFRRDQESYFLFEDHSICVWFGFDYFAAPHTLSSLAAAVEARRKDGLPLPAALRELLIHVVNDERGCWTEAETDTALLLLAAADRDARLKAV